MKVTVLGFWGGYPYKEEGTTSYLVQSGDFSLLLDVGSSTLIQLEKHLDPLRLDAVIVTHYHHDHIADLGVLQYLRQLRPSISLEPLTIYGHQEDEWHFNQLSMPDVSVAKAYQPEERLEIGPFYVTFIKTIHPVPCYAMRIVERETGKVFVFTADTGYFKGLVDFCQEADLLITDTYFLEGNEGHFAHLTSKETGLLAKEAKVKQVVLSHLRQDTDFELLKKQTDAYSGNIKSQIAKTNLQINL